MDGFATLKTYCDKRDGNGSGDAVCWADLDFAFYAWLRVKYVSAPGSQSRKLQKRTRVADMPG